MSPITHKTKRIIVKAARWSVCLLISGMVIAPVPALAASKTYAIACTGSNITTGKGVPAGYFAFCPNTTTPVMIEGIGGAHKPYPSNSEVATIAVDCGSSTPVNPAVGAYVSTIKCKNGSKPSFKDYKLVQAYHPSAPSPPPPHAPASACSASGCDLIKTYVDPAINILSAMFGLIAVISLIMGGIQFTTSEGDPQKASKAKNRISNTILAIFAYALLYGFLQFLVPGGVF